MKLLTNLFFLGALSAAFAELDYLSQEFIDEINEKQSTWIAGRNFAENTTNEYLRKLNGFLGLHPDPNYKPRTVVHNIAHAVIPSQFDARTHWTNCRSLYDIRDQGSCGSCWAFAAVESISDRLCIHSQGSTNFKFSPEDLLSCCKSCGSCDGGYMMAAYDFYLNTGIVSGGDLNSHEGCRPYSDTAYRGTTPACTKSCNNGYAIGYLADKHYGSRDYVIDHSIEQIQYEIMTNGPIIMNFEVFQDFYNYRSGVYQHVSGGSTGYHVVKVLGWGTENGVPYWLMANSWGKNWGKENGFFKIKRGSNECGVENYPYAALPRL